MEILHSLRDQGHTILLASHAVDQVEKNCDCCLCLNRGVVGFGRTREPRGIRSYPGIWWA